MKTLTTLLLIFLCLQINGQVDPLDDFWNKVEKRKRIDKDRLLDSLLNYDIEITALYGKNIVILKQQYVYEKKNKRYVRGNDDSYGAVYGIGVSMGHGIVSSKHMLRPWMNDNSLLPLKGYTPIVTDLKIKSLLDTSSTTKEVGAYSITEGINHIDYSFNVPSDSGIEITKPDSTGLLLLFYYDQKKDTILKQTQLYYPNWKEGVSEIDSQFLKEHLIGGVFFNVDTTQNSKHLLISGVISGDQAREFKLIMLKHILPNQPSRKTGTSRQTKDNIKGEEKLDSSNTSIKGKNQNKQHK